MKITRRDLLSASIGAGALGSVAGILDATRSSRRRKQELPLKDFEPRSMMHLAETRLRRARFPAIDFHTHASLGDDLKGPGNWHLYCDPEKYLTYMDARNIRMRVNLTGGFGEDLKRTLAPSARPMRAVSQCSFSLGGTAFV